MTKRINPNSILKSDLFKFFVAGAVGLGTYKGVQKIFPIFPSAAGPLPRFVTQLLPGEFTWSVISGATAFGLTLIKIERYVARNAEPKPSSEKKSKEEVKKKLPTSLTAKHQKEVKLENQQLKKSYNESRNKNNMMDHLVNDLNNDVNKRNELNKLQEIMYIFLKIKFEGSSEELLDELKEKLSSSSAQEELTEELTEELKQVNRWSKVLSEKALENL